MDNRLLLWSSTTVTHCELPGHTASISAVRSSSDGSLAVSSSYDKTLRIWGIPGADARGGGRGKALGFKGPATCLVGHVAPVLDFAWTAGKVVSGARDGCVILWVRCFEMCFAHPLRFLFVLSSFFLLFMLNGLPPCAAYFRSSVSLVFRCFIDCSAFRRASKLSDENRTHLSGCKSIESLLFNGNAHFLPLFNRSQAFRCRLAV